ncbi:MAG: methyltransferase domain-containing protein [Thermodesulfobacteriota bacterium]
MIVNRHMTNVANTSVYEGEIDLSVRNNSHTITYNFIADTFRGNKARILEVGCNTGYFGETLKLAGHSVFGVEISAECAALAEERLDHVFAGTIEAYLDSPVYSKEQFDCIIFGDVLEHLVNPGEVLVKIRERLLPGGIIVASVPNVAHLAVRLMLLEGRWEYSDRGVLDRTHMRFFDKRGLMELFALTGYRVLSVVSVRLPADSIGIAFDPALLDAISQHVNDDAADVFQYVVQACPGNPNPYFENMPSARVLILPPISDWTIGEIRLSNPLTAWAEKYGGEIRCKSISEYQVRDILWADVIVLQRESSHHIIDLVRRFQQHGKAVIFDIDDLLTDVPKFLATYAHYQRAKQNIESILRNVDMVTTTTQRLASQLTQYNPSIRVIRNCPIQMSDNVRHIADDKPVTIFIASSDTVRVDFIVPALHSLAADSDLHIEIIGIGPPGEFLDKAGIPITCIENLPYQSFLDFIVAHDNAIGIIPLDMSIFSSCKSAIKFLDYGSCGVVSVCSNVPPYNDVVQNEITGVLVDNDEHAWYEAIRRLVLDPEGRAIMASAARKFCRDHYSLSQSADKWQAAIFAARAYRQSIPVGDEPAASLRPHPSLKDWCRLLVSPAAYRSGLWVLLNEGFGGLKKRLNRLGFNFRGQE